MKTVEAKAKPYDITVGDILGPFKTEKPKGDDDAGDRERDANFSLLSYSFSLVCIL